MLSLRLHPEDLSLCDEERECTGGAKELYAFNLDERVVASGLLFLFLFASPHG
jgi:hypothetical protein